MALFGLFYKNKPFYYTASDARGVRSQAGGTGSGEQTPAEGSEMTQNRQGMAQPLLPRLSGLGSVRSSR